MPFEREKLFSDGAVDPQTAINTQAIAEMATSYDLNSVGTHIIEGPADMDIIGIDPSDSTKIITIAPFKLLTITIVDGILSVKSILSIPSGVEVTNSLPAFAGHWLGVRDTAGTYDFFSKEKRLDFNTATECPIGRADRTATDISAIVSLPELGFGYAQTLYDFLATTGSKRLSGGDLQYVNGTITLKRLEGVWWRSFAGKDENNPHKMTNTENNPIASYEIHSATGNVEVVSEMEVGFIDDGAGGKTAIASNEWSFYLCYHWSRFEGVGFEGFQRSTQSFTSLHSAKSLKGAVGELHPALDAAVLTHIIYIKGDTVDFGNPEQCLIEWVRKDNIGSSGDPLVGGLQQSGVIDWVGNDILNINTDTTKIDRGEIKIGSVNRETGVKFLRTVAAETGITVDNLTTSPFTYYGYNITTDSFVQQSTPMVRITMDSIIPIGRIWHRNKTVVDDVQTMPLVAETNHDYAGQLLAFGALKQSGLNLSASGANKKVGLSSGVLEVLGGTFTSREIINICQPTLSVPLSFTPVYKAATTGKVIFETVTDEPDYNVYDDGSGTLATMLPNTFGIHYFYIFPFGNTADVFLIRGDESYSTLQDAQIGLQQNQIPTPSDFKSGFSFSAVIAKNGTSDLQTAITAGDAIISSVDRFGSFGAGGGGASAGGIASLVEDTTPQLGGDLDINNKSLVYQVPTTSLSWSGEVITATAGQTLAFGEVSALGSNVPSPPGAFWRTNADNEATTKGFLAIATGTVTTGQLGAFLLRGFIKDNSWSWVVGGELFLALTDGNFTQTKPTGTGEMVRLVGYAITETVVYFNPDTTYIELV